MSADHGRNLVRVLICPDSFKESLSAGDAAAAMARGVQQVVPDASIDRCPLADGGEGTVDALVTASGGSFEQARVTDPLGRPIDATWGWLGGSAREPRTAVIELAAASGLALLPRDRRDPAKASTFGTGELIARALDAGAERILLGIGGSATNDAGCGAAQALGVRFLDQNDALIEAPITGGDLSRIARIDLTDRRPGLDRVELIVACDVTNPFYGDNGAAFVYAKQKGATAEAIASLDRGLRHIAPLMTAASGQRIDTLPGAGAAGGFGGGAVALLGGRVESGIERILRAVDFETRLARAELCITGEGRLDAQSLSGKVLSGVIADAHRHGVAVIAIAGQIDADAQTLRGSGVIDWHAISNGIAIDEAMRDAPALIERATAARVRAWRERDG